MSINILGLTFYPYGFILGLAILAGLQSSLWLAKKRGIDKKIIEQLFWWTVIGGILGARLYHVIDKWQEIYSLNPQSIFYLWNGGLGIWGAVIGGISVASIWYLVSSKRNIGFLNLLDIILFGLPLGQAIGRWGNFFNNEIVGKNGEPLFLYESILDLVLFGILVWLAKRRHAGSEPVTGSEPGVIAGAYLIGYGIIRFLLEPLRPEAIVWKVGFLPVAIIFSVAAMIGGMVLIHATRKR